MKYIRRKNRDSTILGFVLKSGPTAKTMELNRTVVRNVRYIRLRCYLSCPMDITIAILFIKPLNETAETHNHIISVLFAESHLNYVVGDDLW